MLQEEKYFNGAVQDSDNAIEYTQPNAILDGLNVRIQTQEGNKQGLVITLEGNREITRALPSGTNTVLRSKYFPEVGKAYIFTKNSNGRHRIEEFDVQTETFITIFQDLTDSGSIQLLDWTGVEYIKDVVLIQDKLLYFNLFPSDTIKRLDIEKARSGGYGTLTDEDLAIIVRPPIIPPAAEYTDDDSYNYNNLTGKLFQFRYMYEFDNNERSVYSPISNRPLPTDEQNVTVSTDISNNNAIIVSVDAAWDRVTALSISFRIGDGSWYLLKRVTRDHILSLPDSTIDFAAGRREVFNISNNLYRFVFYNDALYTIEPDVEHDQLADYAPLNSRAMEVVNNNTLLLGNNLYGYDTPDLDQEDAYAEVTYEQSGGTVGGFRVVEFNTLGPTGGPNTFEVIFAGSPTEDDIISSVWQPFSPPIVTYYDNYYVPVADEGDLFATVQSYATHLQNDLGAINVGVAIVGSNVRMDFEVNEGTPGQRFPTSFSISNAIPLNDSIATLKLQSSYQLAVAYYDKYGRPFPLYTNDNMVVKTDAFAVTEGQVPVVKWFLPQAAPPMADHYRICITRNRTHENTWYITAKRSGYATSPQGVATYSLDIGALMAFNAANPDGTLGYDFVSGDRVNIIGKVGTGGTVSPWQNNPIYNFKIKGLFVSDSGGSPVYEISFDVEDSSVQIDENEDYLIEIYRPKAQMSAEVEPYYELPFIYKVVGGDHNVRVGEVRAVDSFIRSRILLFPQAAAQGVIPAESLHFSDYYVSDYDQLGRPRTLNDTPSSYRYIAEIRHSREWISGSRINNINRFYPEDVYDSREPMYGAVENYGGIQYLTARENRLVCVQQIKVGYIPVNRSIIEDTLEQQQVGISSKLLNPIIYSTGTDIGIGNDYSIPSYEYVNGAAYFIDPHEMLPVRAGLDGTRYIQSTYSGEMKRKIREMVTSGNYIFSVWDDRMNEWLVVFNDYTYVYDEKSNGWIPKRSYLPSSGFAANDRLYTTNVNGQLYIHDDESNRNRFYGTDYPAELKFPVTSPRVKTYQSIALHMDDEVETVVDGIETQLGHVSDLVVDDFTWRENIRYANLLRDKNSGTDITNGDRLKGRWITIHLKQEAPVGEWNLLKAVVKSALSSPNNE